jgi:hypothetical protein
MRREIRSPFAVKVDREWFGDWGGGKGMGAARAFRERHQRAYEEAERRGRATVTADADRQVREDPESARQKINRSLAHDVAQQVMSGNASINIDVGAGAKNGDKKKNLFRPQRTKRTPQMPHAGGDTTDWSQYNYE